MGAYTWEACKRKSDINTLVRDSSLENVKDLESCKRY